MTVAMLVDPRLGCSLRVRALMAWLAASLGLPVGMVAQENLVEQSASQARVRSAADVSFELLAAAPFESSYVATRVRRFLTENGRLVQVRERLRLQGDGSKDSPFNLEFVDVAGPSVEPTTLVHWTETYRKSAGLLHQVGGFRVHDPLAAARNYRIHDFGLAQRSGRAVRRVVIFPLRMDKGIWVLDVDTKTGTVLYSAEFDSGLRLLNELETVSFSEGLSMSKVEPGAPAPPAAPAWWQPRMTLTAVDDVDSAAAILCVSLVQPDISQVLPEYCLSVSQLSEDPVNGDRTLVLGYTDGIDVFFVLQTSGVGDPFVAGKPAKGSSAGSNKSHRIATYSDPAMRAYMFFEDGLLFQIVGRDSLLRLKDVALHVCRQAVTR